MVNVKGSTSIHNNPIEGYIFKLNIVIKLAPSTFYIVIQSFGLGIFSNLNRCCGNQAFDNGRVK